MGAFLGGVALAGFSSGLSSTSGQLAVAGFFCYAAVIAISLATGVRMDKLIVNWSVHALPEEWAPIRALDPLPYRSQLFSVLGLATYLLSGMLVS